MAESDIKFASVYVWDHQTSYIVPVKNILHFKLKTFDVKHKKAYQIKLNSSIVKGYINTVGEIRMLLGCNRVQVPPRKFVQSATEYSTDDDLVPKSNLKSTRNQKSTKGIKSVEDIQFHLAKRLIELEIPSHNVEGTQLSEVLKAKFY
ncbi:uncharacterized protein LOC122500728 [Leptopilina heterotoma]|uniref:uncharacterized protein LOC122500728 n=1 Tax=Leptopilina heterotoma TaxID=63436 RepID=UPI001CA98531|nr:uncharacterized protein LOC122500728 [Leptopilina heterotoma]